MEKKNTRLELMTPAEVAEVFRVDPKTVARWSNLGKLPSIRTLGGHRRFAREDVEALLKASQSSLEESREEGEEKG